MARALPFVLMLAIAGCVTPTNDTADTPDASALDPNWAAKIIVPMSDTHDHRDWTHHANMSTPNFQLLAHDPLSTEFYEGKSAGGYFCGGDAVTEDGRKLNVISSLDSDVAFVIVDVTDPAAPMKIGEYVVEGTTHYDVDFTADGRYVVIGSDLDPSGPFRILPVPGAADASLGATVPSLPTPRAYYRDFCSGTIKDAGPEEGLPLSPATILVDVSDPTNPTMVDTYPAPVFGPHSVSTATIDGTTYVASSITNGAQPSDYFQFFRIDETPAATKMVLLSSFDGSQHNRGMGGGGHVDAEIAKHPVTGQLVAYLSDWDGGLVIVDLSVPGTPTVIGSWLDTNTDGGVLHSTRSIPELWDDKHYVIGGQEFIARPSDRPSGWIYVIDDTDPANPVEVSRWTLPLDTEEMWAEGEPCCLETWSTHYFRVIDRTLFVAMYHGGVWAVDLTDPANPKAIGAYVPDRAPPDPRREPTGFYDITPFVLDIFPQPDYTISVYDGYSGLYSVKFDPTMPMPAPTPWPMEGGVHE